MSKSGSLIERKLPMGGQTLEIEVGRMAPQADGAVLLRAGRTVMLVVATSAPRPAARLGFFPLTVEYREKQAAAGRIPGSFFRREGRPAVHEILGSRLVDRSIRPHFPKGYRCETQVLAYVLSFDSESDPEVLAISGAATALQISDIPWSGPVAGVRVARVAGELLAFPSRSQRAAADLDLIVALSRDGLVMVEGDAGEVSEELLLSALDCAQAAAAPLLAAQEELRAQIGRPKRPFDPPRADARQVGRARELVAARSDEIFGPQAKRQRRERLDALEADVTATLEAEAAMAPEPTPPPAAVPGPAGEVAGSAALLSVAEIVSDAVCAEIRRRALAGERLDGRDAQAIREITAEVAWLPAAHGSSFFARGETHAMVTCTLGTSENEQLIEDLHGVHHDRFLLHYNFPPYSVGEVRPLRSAGRRELGHGNLARRALLSLMPDFDAFPYTIRIESEITSSNGSSSMATVCAASLALMDAGVPMAGPVAGIAMGLIAEGEESVILSDILGDEDHLGDMDFKVAGTAQGVTAVQLDNKLGSLSREVLAAALEQAREGRTAILAKMDAVCPAPREQVPPHAPRVVLRQIRPARIRDLIGPGGRHIQEIQQTTGVRVDVSDDGQVRIFAPAGAAVREAEQRIRHLTGEPEVGRIYRGRVTGVTDFGCFVQLFHGIEGLVHVSDLDRGRVQHPSEIAALADEMVVKVLGVSPEGKLRLSRKEALGADPAEIES